MPSAIARPPVTESKFVEENLGLARKVAHRFAKQCSSPYDDLYQLGCIGLIKAVSKFDRSKGVAFSSFAVPYIQGEIQHYLRDHDWDMVGISRRRIEAASKIKRIQRAWINKGRQDVSALKVAQSIGYSPEQWREIEQETARKTILPLEHAQWISVPASDDDLRTELRAAIARLPNPYRSALTAWGLADQSYEAIARSMATTPQQIEAWVQEGLSRVKEAIAHAV